jgi:mRNA-degrading endonuclease YafQ of YafQ-DinJ toxin-antitoxin module
MRQHENEKRKPHDLTVDLNSARLTSPEPELVLLYTPEREENEIKWKTKV